MLFFVCLLTFACLIVFAALFSVLEPLLLTISLSTNHRIRVLSR